MTENELPWDSRIEQSVLGTLIAYGTDVFVDVIGELEKAYFYDVRHQKIYQALLNLFYDSEPIDIKTVSAKCGEDVTSIVQEAIDIDALDGYVETLKRFYIRRFLIYTGNELSFLGLNNKELSARDLLNEATAKILSSDVLNSEGGFVGVDVLAKKAKERIETLRNTPGLPGFGIGIADLDFLMGGLQGGDLVIIAGRPGSGKCLGYGTKVVMVDGTLKEVQDIKPGDKLLGPDSKPRNVLSTTTGRELMYWVRQKRGIDYRANESHVLSLKRCKTEKAQKRGDVLNISIKDAVQRAPHYLLKRYKGYRAAIELPERSTIIDPYFLGLWLGDGSASSARIFTKDTEVIEYLQEYAKNRQEHVSITCIHGSCPAYLITSDDWQIQRAASLQVLLRRLGILGNKHIPEDYLLNSKINRLKLLAGLIDSDGSYASRHYEIIQKSEKLIKQIRWLCNSLGYWTNLRIKRVNDVDYYRLSFGGKAIEEIPTKVEHKKANGNKDWDYTLSSITLEKDKIDNYYGFELDGDGLFLLEDMTVTHNTALMIGIATYISMNGGKVGIFSYEMEGTKLVDRIAAYLSVTDLQFLRTAQVPEEQIPPLYDAYDYVATLPISIDDGGRGNIAYILGKAKQLALQGKLDVLCIDYLQLIPDHKKDTRNNVLGEITQRLKNLAMELGISILLGSQLNRAVESRDNKRPILADLRDSGNIEQDSDIVIFIYRAEMYEGKADNEGEAELIVAKNRFGPPDIVHATFEKKTAHFEVWGDWDDGKDRGKRQVRKETKP